MACKFTELVIDCHDPKLVGEFWRDVLGYDITNQPEDGEWVELTGPPGSGPTILCFRNPDEKTVKNRLHIDVNPTDRDRDAEVERVIALGGRRIDIGQGPDVSWVVLADPEGNEFCVLGSRVEP